MTDRREIIEEMGCIACRKEGYWSKPEIYHIADGPGYTIGLCPWHRRAEEIEGWSFHMMECMMGPSLANNKKTFEDWYGTETQLMVETDAEVAAQSS